MSLNHKAYNEKIISQFYQISKQNANVLILQTEHVKCIKRHVWTSEMKFTVQIDVQNDRLQSFDRNLNTYLSSAVIQNGTELKLYVTYFHYL